MSLRKTIAFVSSRGGAVSFRDWMDAALFEPEFGYYSRNVPGIGRRGDFATSATLAPALGGAVAAWIRQEWVQFPTLRRKPRHVIEIGPGDGSLAESVWRHLGFWSRLGTQFHLVDRSAPLIARQRERLEKRGGFRWHTDLRSALEAAGGVAVIYSNELIDAFPVTLAQWHQGSWLEVWLECDAENRLLETLRPLPTDLASSAMHPQQEITGQRIEIAAACRDWLADWVPKARHVSILTIDYGDTASELYIKRLHGTLRAYLAHQRQTGTAIYENMGRQDLTADVNFTDLIRWGEPLGLRAERLRTQREFLLEWVPQLCQDRAGHFLTAADGAGDAFKVLVQRKG